MADTYLDAIGFLGVVTLLFAPALALGLYFVTKLAGYAATTPGAIRYSRRRDRQPRADVTVSPAEEADEYDHKPHRAA